MLDALAGFQRWMSHEYGAWGGPAGTHQAPGQLAKQADEILYAPQSSTLRAAVPKRLSADKSVSIPQKW